ncbi:hypothetical protein [Archangium sp.]|jgi:hypothetical protein|uniref:hypothetical protein n=1 Tax=Archangium sp. TaxID=1872627 RepID=UPI002ED958DD
MRNTPDLLFRETMSGPLAPGAWDPLHGEHAGHATPFTLHSTLRIDSLEAFLGDPSHEARLEGEVSFPPFGDRLPVLHGSFQLFSPTEDPGMRLMRYGVTFAHAQREYFLAGTKFLQDAPGSNLWRETTRLYSTLHEGPSNRGPVVGAGVLTIGVSGFLQLLASLRAPRGGAETVVRFGQFFLGNLWDLYARLPEVWPVRFAPSRTPWD